MADKIFAGLDASTIETSPKFDAYTKVTVTNGENSWSKGTAGGRELTVEIPIATDSNGATMAQNILNKINGFRYQPYNATDAVISLAAEIGDGITIGGVYGGIYSQDIVFDSGSVSDVSAPNDEEIDSEYPFLSAQERDAIRQRAQTEANTSAIETNASYIADVDSRVSSIEADYITTNQLDAVSARVSSIEANQITVDYLQANYCEINGATINNIKSRLVDCETIFTQSGYAGTIYATGVGCSRINMGSYTATWQSKTIGGTTIYYLGRS